MPLENLASGEKKIALVNLKTPAEELGNIIVNVVCNQVENRLITLTNVYAMFNEGGDMMSSSDPYINVRVGGWSARTETGDGKSVTFKKQLKLRYST